MPVRLVVRLEPTRPEAVPPRQTGPAINAAFWPPYATRTRGGP